MLTAPVGSLDTLLETLDLRRPAVAAHSRRVAACARQLGHVVGLDSEDLVALGTAALVHDVGTLLGRPTDVPGLEAWCGLSEDVSDILWYASRRFDHHRHAPIAARLLAVAHAFDDLTSAREYQVSMRPDTARMAIAREAGRCFCPLAANALMMVQTVEAAGPWKVDYRFVTNS